MAAVESVHHFDLEKVASASSVEPGDLITYSLTIIHDHKLDPMTKDVLTGTLPVGTTSVFATLPYTQIGDTIRWDFPPMDTQETRSVDLAVLVDISTTGTIANEDYAVKSDQLPHAPVPPVPSRMQIIVCTVTRRYLSLEHPAARSGKECTSYPWH